MDALITNHLGAVVASLSALAVLVGGLVGVVLKVLQVYRWLMREFDELKGAIMSIQHGVDQRFNQHESEEREWRYEVSGSIEDVRERLARMEGKLEAAERYRRIEDPKGRPEY